MIFYRMAPVRFLNLKFGFSPPKLGLVRFRRAVIAVIAARRLSGRNFLQVDDYAYETLRLCYINLIGPFLTFTHKSQSLIYLKNSPMGFKTLPEQFHFCV